MPAKIKDMNPLNSVEATVDLMYADDSVKRDQTLAVSIHENDLSDAFHKLMKKRFVNVNEAVPLTLLNGSVIVRVQVTAIETLKDGNEKLTYGVLEK